MTLGKALVLREVFDAFRASPILMLILILNAGMVYALIYVANIQREERQTLTKLLVESCEKK